MLCGLVGDDCSLNFSYGEFALSFVTVIQIKKSSAEFGLVTSFLLKSSKINNSDINQK